MAKATRIYFCENFDGVEIANIYPSESFPLYGMWSLVPMECDSIYFLLNHETMQPSAQYASIYYCLMNYK